MLCNESAPQRGRADKWECRQTIVHAAEICVRIAVRCGRVALGALERNSSKGNAVR